jgi:hypothetical protein
MMRRVPEKPLEVVRAPEGWVPDWGYENDDEWINRLKGAGYDDVADALETLTKAGCDRSYLIGLVKYLGSTLRPRLSKADIGKAIKALNKAVEWIDRTQKSDLGFMIRPNDLNHVTGLMADLDEYSQVLEGIAALADRRAARTHDHAVATLVRHVKRATGHWHDTEVALLVLVAGDIERYRWFETKGGIPVGGWWDLPEEVLPKPNPLREEYDEVAHAQWRKRHGQLLKHETVIERHWTQRRVGGTAQPGLEVKRERTEIEPQPRGVLVMLSDPTPVSKKPRPRRARKTSRKKP